MKRGNNVTPKITIGLFCDSFFPVIDGVVMVVDNYARRLSKYANVIVFVPNVPGSDHDDSIYPYKIIRCKAFNIPFLGYPFPTPNISRNFGKEVKKYKLDLIHIHSPITIGKYGARYAKKHNIPLIGTMHSQFEQDVNRYIKSKKISNKIAREVTKMYNKCDECWAVNGEVARIFYEDYGYKKLPQVMGNATDMLPILDVKKTNKLINKQFNLKSSETVLLFVGRINKLKNILFIVDSLKILKDRNFKFKMLFVGAGPDERLLQEYIHENNLDEEILLLGKITDRNLMASLYARANLFLFPSLYDASSLVQIEAASQKTPTIFLEDSVTSATVTNNRNGFLSKNNPHDYADVIIKVIKDKKLYDKVSNYAFEELYKNWDDLVDEVYSQYLYYINK